MVKAEVNKQARSGMIEKITKLYNELSAAYGESHWWPAETPYEVMVGAVLTQNTNWSNVETALANFPGGVSPEGIAAMDLEELKIRIRPAGFFNQKAVYLKALTQWFAGYDYRVELVQKEAMEKIRKELRAVRGIGNETADSILLYAFAFPSFVVDAYTVRLCHRLPLPVGTTYHQVKATFESSLKPDAPLYNNLHALIVLHGKAHCRKRPLCGDCPLTDRCQKVDVVAPAL